MCKLSRICKRNERNKMSNIAAGRVIFLQKKLDDLIEAYEDYLKLMGDEFDELSKPIYHFDGKVKRQEQRNRAVEKIKQIKKRK